MREDGTYRASECKICRGMGVQANPRFYNFWRRYLQEAWHRASAGEVPDRTIFQAAERRVSMVLANYSPCSFCEGEGAILRRLPDAPRQTGIEHLFEGGDGWLNSDDDAAH